jgi:hypothetical protein
MRDSAEAVAGALGHTTLIGIKDQTRRHLANGGSWKMPSS